MDENFDTRRYVCTALPHSQTGMRMRLKRCTSWLLDDFLMQLDLARLKPKAVHMNKIMWSSLYSTWIGSPDMIIFMCTAFPFWFCKVNTNCCRCANLIPRPQLLCVKGCGDNRIWFSHNYDVAVWNVGCDFIACKLRQETAVASRHTAVWSCAASRQLVEPLMDPTLMSLYLNII